MDQLRGIDAEYVNWRTVIGRRVLQLVFEIDIARQQEVLTMLGTPTVGESKWVAIALLDTELVRERPSPPTNTNGEREVSGSASTSLQAEGGSPKKWSEYNRSQQGAILCGDPEFWKYFETTEKYAAQALRMHFRINSRKDLDLPENHARWDEFVALYNLHRERRK